jgi:hypothetical protein
MSGKTAAARDGAANHSRRPLIMAAQIELPFTPLRITPLRNIALAISTRAKAQPLHL